MSCRSAWCAVALTLAVVCAVQPSGQAIAAEAGAHVKTKNETNRHMQTGAQIPAAITLFLSGDVMTGRGIDQVLPHPSHPAIYEPYMKSARGYVQIAEQANGPIDYPVDFPYIWGEALDEWERAAPDVRIVNLETSVTKSNDYWPGKGINYRMHPQNTPVLTAAKIDVCALANNHVLDWGYTGLLETLQALRSAGIKTAGAGRNQLEARSAAVAPVPGKGRVLVFSFGLGSSGIPDDWNAGDQTPGVFRLKDLNSQSLFEVTEKVAAVKHSGDVVVASVHWGGNWGFDISRRQQAFARRLIDEAGVDVVHGHSSHHVRAIEVYKGKLILYGCGDFVNDYEGIGGHEEYRGDLSLMYFATIDAAGGKLLELVMTPTQVRRFRVVRAGAEDAAWLTETLTRQGAAFGTRVTPDAAGRLRLQWD